ncbi:thioredoxin domain-containing protein [Actinocatenispora sera]|uniref:Membrane protein n=1 Tax=Actinocatenispora sera TaxID=390989 RepID=A0A810L2D9_9ACTN|nr:thioredoxin domain-containing protein [Actinocatenispora sera]BCJ29059.1 membrane protein [Actinocatenispora sera]
MASKNKPKSASPPAAGANRGKGGGGTAKQRARAAKAVAAARAERQRRNRIIITASICAVLLIVVVGAVSWAVYESNKPKTIAAQSITANYPVKLDNGVVVAGKDSAKVKIDIYEDFMCPYCGELERGSHTELQKGLNGGTLQVRYHIVDLLNGSSTPAGYSDRAANIALGTVAEGKFAQFHWSLYHKQPAEGGPGYSDEQMIDLADRLGADKDKISKIAKDGTYKKYPAQQLKDFQAAGYQGTPTVVQNGKQVQISDLNKPDWLNQLLAA